MSRSGYTDDCENVAMWRGVVASAIRGKRGQAFFRALIDALDAMPVKCLIHNDLQVQSGEVCALGALAIAKGIDPTTLDTENYPQLGAAFNIAEQLAQEAMWVNDDDGPYNETPEHRWERVHKWAVANLKAPAP